MAQTSVGTSSTLTVKEFSVAMFAGTQRANTLLKNMTGPAPKQAAAEAKLKGQTSPDMPVVRVTDLSKTQGDAISMDLFNIIGGKPLIGDVNAEGKGEKLTWSSMDAKIDLTTKVVDAGGKMAQQRTKHSLRGVAMATLMGYFPRLEVQQTLVHLAGARGAQAGIDWVVPKATDSDFASIMVNTVRAPTYNRHYVVNGANLTQGGLQTASLGSGDTLKLSHIDQLREILDDLEFGLQQIKIPDDPAAEDEPMWMLLVGPRAFADLIQDTTANGNIRSFQQNAFNRASHGSKHPLFRGEVGMWNGILVRKMPRSIRFVGASVAGFEAGDNAYNYVAVANRYAGTETGATVNASRVVERCLLLGAQALANVYGRNAATDYYTTFKERTYNWDRNYEAMGECMNGKTKVRFNVADGAGNNEPTDLGVMALDVTVG